MTVLVLLLSLYLLESFFGYGLIIEDWKLAIPFRVAEGNFFQKFIASWYTYGPSMAHQVIYLGALDQLFPYNYELYQKLNFIWKVLATLSLLPTVWVLTKDKLLAVLCTLFFTISYTASGSLAFIIDGVDYLAIIYLNVFTICYYLYFRSKQLKFFVLAALLLYAAVLTSLHRIYPFFFIIIVAEVAVVIKKISSPYLALSRLLVLLLPPFLMIRFLAPERLVRADVYTNLLKPLIDGNIHLIHTPLSGLGFQFMPISYEKLLFGPWEQVGLRSYLIALWKPLLLVIVMTPIIASLITSKVRWFTIRALVIQAVFLIGLHYLIIFHHQVPKELLIPTDWGIQLDVFWGAVVASYFISISLVSGLLWWKEGRKNIVPFLLCSSVLFSLLFLFGTWLIVGHSFTYEYTIHRYLTFPSIGSSIFLAALVYAGLRKPRIVQSIFLVLLVLYVFITAKGQIDYNFQRWKSLGVEMNAQKSIQDRLYFNHLKTKNNYVYYEQRSMTETDLYWNGALIYEFYADWVPLRKYAYSNTNIQDWCVGVPAYHFNDLKRAAKLQPDGSFNFQVHARCGKEAMRFQESVFADQQAWEFNQDEFFAFTLKDGAIVDITKEILDKLSSEQVN